jgi:hypothetical protein
LKIQVVLRNPRIKSDHLSYVIEAQDHKLAHDWAQALKMLLQSGKPIEKNFCFMGFPNTARDLPYLCDQMNLSIAQINQSFKDYCITEHFDPLNCLATDYAEHGPNHDLFNRIHNHFEFLQGTVDHLSNYYARADYNTKYAIRQINNLCHEMETLILSQRKAATAPEWVRPSQITTWLTADRYALESTHRAGFATNGYDRVTGGVYMHWTQIGKTLFEVFRDEGAPDLTTTVCDAITHLQYYSGEFDIEWGRSVTTSGDNPWHAKEQQQFAQWLKNNQLDPSDPELSLGYLPIAQVDLQGSFGTDIASDIWPVLGNYLDIYRIEVDGVSQTYDYCWTDADYQQQQIQQLKPGYDYQTRCLNEMDS